MADDAVIGAEPVEESIGDFIGEQFDVAEASDIESSPVEEIRDRPAPPRGRVVIGVTLGEVLLDLCQVGFHFRSGLEFSNHPDHIRQSRPGGQQRF